MTFTEADEIFQVWRKWYWPCHIMLYSIFGDKIPASFCPFPKDILEEALNIVAKKYHDMGDHKSSKLVQDSIVAIWEYAKDEDALVRTSERLSIPEIREMKINSISNFKKDYKSWIDRQEK